MNIAINGLFLSLKNTGGGRYLTDLVAGLQPFGRDIKYFLFTNNNINRNKIVSSPFVETIDCGWMIRFRPSRILWENLILPEVIKKRKIDLLHAAGFTLPGRISCKSVITIFDMTFFTMPQLHLASKVAYFQKMIPVALKKADKIIAISKQTKNDIINIFGVAQDKIRVIYIGAGKEFRVISDKDAVEGIKQKYGLPKKYILFVGTIEPRKNIKGLIHAYEVLKKKGYEHKLVIVGKRGWHYSDIFEAVRRLKLNSDIIFTDYVLGQDLPFIYNGASIFVYPSFYEGFGIPVLEAMSCGIPVVTSGVSSLPEIAGEAALLINPMDIEGISISIDKILRDSHLANALVKKGLDRASLFSIEKLIAETVQVYKEVLSSS
jgi:glycosyltransferase involved in cell wall biosynthesis